MLCFEILLILALELILNSLKYDCNHVILNNPTSLPMKFPDTITTRTMYGPTGASYLVKYTCQLVAYAVFYMF